MRKWGRVFGGLLMGWVLLAPTPGADATPAAVAYIDTHAHLNPSGGCSFDDAVTAAVAAMDGGGLRSAVVMPAPNPEPSTCGEVNDLAAAVSTRPDRFALLGGGASLMGLLQEALDAGEVTPAMLSTFEETALDILATGAVGFGEIAAEHLSFRASQPYFSVPPDHPLFLLLADLAARYGVPIELHMEAVSAPLPLPAGLQSPPNPATLAENIAAFERLLDHDRGARIVWAHAGWDNTGDRTVELMRRLLHDHPNLSMNIKLRSGNRPNGPLDTTGRLDPAWRRLISEFPTRFMIGTDLKYPDDSLSPLDLTRQLLDQLPPGLAALVGFRNAVRTYNLDRRLVCHAPGTPGAQSAQVELAALAAHLAHGDTLGPCRN